MDLRLTDLTRRVLQAARTECRRFNHGTLQTCHLLAGFLHAGQQGLVTNLLLNLQLDLRTVRLEIEKLGLPDLEAAMGLETFSISETMNSILEKVQEANERDPEAYVGSEYLLQLLMETPDALIMQILNNRGLTPAMVLNELLGQSSDLPTTDLPLPACRDPGVLFWPAELLWVRYLEAQRELMITEDLIQIKLPDFASPADLAQALHRIATLAEDPLELRLRWQILLLWGYPALKHWFSWKFTHGMPRDEVLALHGKWLPE